MITSILVMIANVFLDVYSIYEIIKILVIIIVFFVTYYKINVAFILLKNQFLNIEKKMTQIDNEIENLKTSVIKTLLK